MRLVIVADIQQLDSSTNLKKMIKRDLTKQTRLDTWDFTAKSYV